MDKKVDLQAAGLNMHELLTELWPLHRTVNSDDMERALDICGRYLDDDRWRVERYAPGTEAFTWIVPERYEVREAWLEVGGRRVADFAENPLHVLSYSEPARVEGTLGEIRDHIWTRPDRPDDVPWEFKYYERSWGWCVRHRDIEGLPDDTPVRGVIDAEFSGRDLCLGEIRLPGESGREAMFLTNICHPWQVNDSLAGLAVGLEMVRILADRPRRLGLRLLVVPETIGTLAWFSRHREQAANIDYAWFAEMLGHDAPFILQHSRQGDVAAIDRAFLLALRNNRSHGPEQTGEFRKVVASDEIVTNGPGLDIPTPSLTRGRFPEYHTSGDNPSIVKPENLAEGLAVFLDLWDILEENIWPRRTFMGPVMLSRFGLWVDWRDDWDLNLKTEALMLMLEGDKSLVDIAFELGLPFETVRVYLERFREAGLVEIQQAPWEGSAPSLA